MADSVQHFIG